MELPGKSGLLFGITLSLHLLPILRQFTDLGVGAAGSSVACSTPTIETWTTLVCRERDRWNAKTEHNLLLHPITPASADNFLPKGAVAPVSEQNHPGSHLVQLLMAWLPVRLL